MTLGYRGKLLVFSLALIAIAVTVAFVYTRGVIYDTLADTARQDLGTRARIARSRTEVSKLAMDDMAGWDKLADDLGEAADARVTFIRADGKVLGDSQLSYDRVRGMESLSDRAEVKQALEGASGTSQRLSTTAGAESLFVALPLKRGGATVGVIRLALPVKSLEAGLDELRTGVLLGSLLALAVAIVLTGAAAQVASRATRRLTAVARSMAEGDLDSRAEMEEADEFGELGDALDVLASNLSTSLGELTSERDKMRSILEAMQEGLLLLDIDGRIRHVNPALREMLLLDSNVVGKTLLEAVRQSELHSLFVKARESGEGTSGEIELSGLKPRRLLVQVRPVPENGVLAVFVDVTDMRRLEGMRRDFVANVSHELRTPVAAIRSAAETLLSGAKDDPKYAGRFIDIIDRNAERLHALVEDLLSLSSIEAGSFRLNLESLHIEPICEQVLGMFTERAQRKRMLLDYDVAEDLPAIRADRRAMEHILSNLVDNAVKYCSEGDEIHIHAVAKTKTLELEVRDTGPGVPEKHVSRLFERFYRVDKGRSRDLGGTGLGLAIVKHLVEAQGGRISVESELGKGSTFRIVLPLVVEALPAPTTEIRVA